MKQPSKTKILAAIYRYISQQHGDMPTSDILSDIARDQFGKSIYDQYFGEGRTPSNAQRVAAVQMAGLVTEGMSERQHWGPTSFASIEDPEQMFSWKDAKHNHELIMTKLRQIAEIERVADEDRLPARPGGLDRQPVGRPHHPESLPLR